ncbi:unnamed protein product [Pichia kudriavzevii]
MLHHPSSESICPLTVRAASSLKSLSSNDHRLTNINNSINNTLNSSASETSLASNTPSFNINIVSDASDCSISSPHSNRSSIVDYSGPINLSNVSNQISTDNTWMTYMNQNPTQLNNSGTNTNSNTTIGINTNGATAAATTVPSITTDAGPWNDSTSTNMSQESLSNFTFTNWNFNSLQTSSNLKKSLEFSMDDPFLPSNLKQSSPLLNDGFNRNINNSSFINESVRNNQFLNKQQQQLQQQKPPTSVSPLSASAAKKSLNWNNMNSILNDLTNQPMSHRHSGSFSQNSTCSSIGDELVNQPYYQAQLTNLKMKNAPVEESSNKIPQNLHYNSCINSGKANINRQLFKTELCETFQKTGKCPYNEKCQFAHGLHELKLVSKPKKWKTKMCKNWIESGFCRYGKRCCYKHGENDDGSNGLNCIPSHQNVLY